MLLVYLDYNDEHSELHDGHDTEKTESSDQIKRGTVDVDEQMIPFKETDLFNDLPESFI